MVIYILSFSSHHLSRDIYKGSYFDQLGLIKLSTFYVVLVLRGAIWFPETGL